VGKDAGEGGDAVGAEGEGDGAVDAAEAVHHVREDALGHARTGVQKGFNGCERGMG
jgi:hypothetical protein